MSQLAIATFGCDEPGCEAKADVPFDPAKEGSFLPPKGWKVVISVDVGKEGTKHYCPVHNAKADETVLPKVPMLQSKEGGG